MYQLGFAIVERDLATEVRLDLAVDLDAVALQGGLLNFIPVYVLQPIGEELQEWIILGIVVALTFTREFRSTLTT